MRPSATPISFSPRSGHGPADWLMHVAGLLVFVSAFGSIFILSGCVAAGLTIAEALAVDGGLFAAGSVLGGGLRLQRAAAERRAVACHRRAGVFARKDVAAVPVRRERPMKKARAIARPSLDVCGGRTILPVA